MPLNYFGKGNNPPGGIAELFRTTLTSTNRPTSAKTFEYPSHIQLPKTRPDCSMLRYANQQSPMTEIELVTLSVDKKSRY